MYAPFASNLSRMARVKTTLANLVWWYRSQRPPPATSHVTSPLWHISPYKKWPTFTQKETYIHTKRDQYSHNIGQFGLMVLLLTPASCYESCHVTLMTSHVTHMTHTSHVTYIRHLSRVTSRRHYDTSPHIKHVLHSHKKSYDLWHTSMTSHVTHMPHATVHVTHISNGTGFLWAQHKACFGGQRLLITSHIHTHTHTHRHLMVPNFFWHNTRASFGDRRLYESQKSPIYPPKKRNFWKTGLIWQRRETFVTWLLCI